MKWHVHAGNMLVVLTVKALPMQAWC